eukprot:s21_g6.t1
MHLFSVEDEFLVSQVGRCADCRCPTEVWFSHVRLSARIVSRAWWKWTPPERIKSICCGWQWLDGFPNNPGIATGDLKRKSLYQELATRTCGNSWSSWFGTPFFSFWDCTWVGRYWSRKCFMSILASSFRFHDGKYVWVKHGSQHAKFDPYPYFQHTLFPLMWSLSGRQDAAECSSDGVIPTSSYGINASILSNGGTVATTVLLLVCLNLFLVLYPFSLCLAFLSALPYSTMTDAAALVHAIRTGDKEEVRRILRSGHDPKISAEGTFPLLVAAEQGRAELVQLLLDAKADANVTQDGLTAMQLAFNAGNQTMVKLLFANAFKSLESAVSIKGPRAEQFKAPARVIGEEVEIDAFNNLRQVTERVAQLGRVQKPDLSFKRMPSMPDDLKSKVREDALKFAMRQCQWHYRSPVPKFHRAR